MNLSDNNSVKNVNISSSSTSTSHLVSSSIVVTDTRRRGAPLPSRSPQVAPRFLSDLTIHWVVSGDVNSTRSPTSIRRTNTASDVLDDRSSNTTTQSVLNEHNHVVINNDISPVHLLQKQSDDEADINDNQTNANISKDKSELAT